MTPRRETHRWDRGRRSALRSVGAAWLTMTALILVMANEVAIPIDFVVRPILVALVPALAVGLLTAFLGRYGPLAAIVASPLLLIPALWPWAAGVAIVEAAIAFLRRSSRVRLPVGRFAAVTMIVLVGVSLARLLPSVGDYLGPGRTAATDGGPPVYLLLLDGYPRIDSLREIGIDNSAFVGELETRGFDHYLDATSAHQWTHRTLQALVAGSADGIPDEPGSNAEERAVRASLQLPDGYMAIDPPASHVVMRGGWQVSAGGLNDFEVRLLGTSIAGMMAREWTADVVAGSLRGHFEESLRLMVESTASRTFAHVLAPHPPFLYAGGLSACWPGCDIFDVAASKLEISVDEWADRMGGQLRAVNERVLAAVDQLLGDHPDAVIVLFSDHGGRYDLELDEVHRSFLAARTPDHPGLLADEPHPHAVLRLIEGTYP